MAEYIDREELLKKIWMGNSDSIVLRDYASTMAKDIPAADVAPVVRCKSCKWAKRDIVLNKYKCTRGLLTEVREDDFCSYGERGIDNG